ARRQEKDRSGDSLPCQPGNGIKSSQSSLWVGGILPVAAAAGVIRVFAKRGEAPSAKRDQRSTHQKSPRSIPARVVGTARSPASKPGVQDPAGRDQHVNRGWGD